MLRMIRSAKSRLSRDGSTDENCAAASNTNIASRRPSVGSDAADAHLDGIERPVKRMAATRGVLGGGSKRLSRSRLSVDGAKSENAGSVPLQAPAAASAVLSDVTNTAGQQWQAPSQRSSTNSLPLEPKDKDSGVSKTREPSPSTPSEADLDPAYVEDPQNVADYVSDIYKHLQGEESVLRVQPNYMERQIHINSKMRSILVDWLVDVHKKYKLRPETLFLGIALVDRYLEQRITARKYLQLVGITALLIAAKFEELYPPQISDFVYVTDKTYTKDDVIKMEISMLTALELNICQPTAVHFLERYQRINCCTDAHRDLAQYLLELTLIDYKMLKYAPSHLAAAAILLSNKLLKRQPSWTPAAVKSTRMPEHALKECAKEMCGLLEQAETSPLQAVRKKFSQVKHHAVAKLNFASNQPPAPPSALTPTPNRLPLPPALHGSHTAQPSLPPPLAGSVPGDSRALCSGGGIGRRPSGVLRQKSQGTPMQLETQPVSAVASEDMLL
eukprot:TRINITY_DN32059_c0_g1_i1.p1 TRINITY_DN32059_c0_g1~~TRINITY_DN32059_c0_g1_i1.p1  ORF type:complete len:502 (+),score=101.20 TRINITY_DN32059_c0_g1_i1:43-1548(+)